MRASTNHLIPRNASFGVPAAAAVYQTLIDFLNLADIFFAIDRLQ
jgi:hypothetical protein